MLAIAPRVHSIYGILQCYALKFFQNKRRRLCIVGMKNLQEFCNDAIIALIVIKNNGMVVPIKR